MSTPSKKKVTKPVEAKARYNNGNKVFIISWAFTQTGQIFEGEVRRVITTKDPIISENGRITGSQTLYSYLLYTQRGELEVPQDSIYPSFVEAAKVFAKGFLFSLK